MKIAGIAPLFLLSALSACVSSHESVPLEAPNIHFQKALVMAEASIDARRQIEQMVADEMQRRRPHVQVVLSSEQFPELGQVTREHFLAYLENSGIDLVMTITPFAEGSRMDYAERSKVKNEELGDHVARAQAHEIAGRFGVQVVGWDTKTKRPVYAKTSETLVGTMAGPRGVASFAVTTVSRDL